MEAEKFLREESGFSQKNLSETYSKKNLWIEAIADDSLEVLEYVVKGFSGVIEVDS